LPVSLAPEIKFSKSQIDEMGKFCIECDEWQADCTCGIQNNWIEVTTVTAPKDPKSTLSITIPPLQKVEVPLAPPKKQLERKRSEGTIIVPPAVAEEKAKQGSVPIAVSKNYGLWRDRNPVYMDFLSTFNALIEGEDIFCKHMSFRGNICNFLSHVVTYHSNEKIPEYDDPTYKSAIESISTCQVCKKRRCNYNHLCPEHTFYGSKASYFTEEDALKSTETFIASNHCAYVSYDNGKWVCQDVDYDAYALEQIEKMPVKPPAFRNLIHEEISVEKKPANLREAFDTGKWDIFEKYLNEFIDSKIKNLKPDKKKPQPVPQEKTALPPKKEVKQSMNSTVEARLKEIWPKNQPGSRRWLRRALSSDIEKATADFKSGKLTKETFDKWLATNHPLPKVEDSKLLISEINKTWFDYKSKNPDVKVYQNPSTEKEREALNLRKELWKKASKLSDEEKKKLSIPKVRVQPKKKDKNPPRKGKNSPKASTDLLGGLSPLFALLKELKAVFTN
jgi:hypothetical protein